MDAVLVQMARRAPGRDKTATPRRESDQPRVLSGLLDGRTTGAPLCMVIQNENSTPAITKTFCLVPAPATPITPARCGMAGLAMFAAAGISAAA